MSMFVFDGYMIANYSAMLKARLRPDRAPVVFVEIKTVEVEPPPRQYPTGRGLGRRFTASDDAIIRRGYALGTSCRDLGERLGVGRISVSDRAKRLGLFHPGAPKAGS